MKILQRCQSCKNRKFIIRKRVYKHRIAGEITSQSLLCRGCYKDIKKMLK